MTVKKGHATGDKINTPLSQILQTVNAPLFGRVTEPHMLTQVKV